MPLLIGNRNSEIRVELTFTLTLRDAALTLESASNGEDEGGSKSAYPHLYPTSGFQSSNDTVTIGGLLALVLLTI